MMHPTIISKWVDQVCESLDGIAGGLNRLAVAQEQIAENGLSLYPQRSSFMEPIALEIFKGNPKEWENK